MGFDHKLFEVMGFMGFDQKWSSSIRALLTSVRASVLVNGSPTNEFVVQRGLRQGDPYPPSFSFMRWKVFIWRCNGLGRLMFLERSKLEGMGLRCPTFSMWMTRSSCVTGRWRMRNEFFGFYVVFSGIWSQNQLT